MLANGADQLGRIIGELPQKQLTHVRMNHQLTVGFNIQRACRIGFTKLGCSVDLANVVQQAGAHRQGDLALVATAARTHQGTSHRHGFDSMLKQRRACGLRCTKQQLHNRVQADGERAPLQSPAVRDEQRR